MAPSALLPGSIFATDFRIVRTLGEGGMGAVYVAQQLSTGKERALKTMLAQFVADAGLRERFAQEARIGARIESEHVVDVVAAGIDAATKMPWLAMELLKGETVEEAVARGRIAEPSFAKESLLQLGDALAEAHAAGVVHRDLKPENLFLTTTKRAEMPFVLKVLDFGIAKLLSENASRVTATVGTPMWMAPEQTEVGAAITPATDIWAYGLIAFYVLTGQSYWHVTIAGREVSSAALLRQIVLDPLPLASERAAQLGVTALLPLGFDAWFARCVARDPAARFNDGRAALDAMRKLFEPTRLVLAATVPAASLPTSRLAPAGPRSDKNAPNTPNAPNAPAGSRIRNLAFALVAALAVGGGAYAVSQRRAPRHRRVVATAAVPSQPPPASTHPTGATPTEPRDERFFSATPIELKWAPTGDATGGHDVEVARGEAAAVQGHAPSGASTLAWPWPGESARPGGYRWRVRETGKDWSEWATFSFYASLLDRIVDQKKLRVGMASNYHEPFFYYDAHQKKVVGFDVDLANELASSLGATVESVPHPWKELFPAVEARELDVVLSAMMITKDRTQKFGFSDAYLRTGVVVVTRAASDHLAAPGTGRTIGAQRATSAAQTAKHSFPRAAFRDYDTRDAAFAALARSEIDALLEDETMVLARAELKGRGYRVDSARLTDDAYGIMLPLGDEPLRMRLNEIVKQLIASGRIAELKKTYGIR